MFTGPSGMKDGKAGSPVFSAAASRFFVGDGALLQRQLDDAMLKPPLERKLALQIFLPCDGGHGAVDAEHLMVARDHLARRAGLAFVEQDEVLDDVQQPVMRQHPIEQNFGLDRCPCPSRRDASIRRNAPTRW